MLENSLCVNEGKLTDKPTSYHPKPELRCWVVPPQCPLHLWTTGACEGAGPADPKVKDLHSTGQQQDSQQESHWGPIINNAAGVRGLEPDQWFIAMNKHLKVKMYGLLCDSLCLTTASMPRLFFFFKLVWLFWFSVFCFVLVFFWVLLCFVWRGDCKGRGQMWGGRGMDRIVMRIWNPQRINFKNVQYIWCYVLELMAPIWLTCP